MTTITPPLRVIEAYPDIQPGTSVEQTCTYAHIHELARAKSVAREPSRYSILAGATVLDSRVILPPE